MSDENKTIVEDDFLDDDMDFGDFDDELEGDLDVDLDIEDDLDADDWDGADDLGSVEASNKSGKDSFVKKNFNLIVIAAVVVGGGGFVVTQMGGAPAPIPSVDPAPDTFAQQGQTLDLGEMPPAPASVDVSEDALGLDSVDDGLDENLPVELSSQDDAGALTPLPSFGEASDDLVPLEFLADDAPDDSGEAFEFLPDDMAEDISVPDLDVVMDGTSSALPVDAADENVAELEPLSALPVIEEPAAIEEIPVIEEPPVAVDDSSLELDDALDRESALLVENQSKDAEIDTAKGTISALEGKVGSLEAQIQELNASVEQARAAQKAAEKAASAAQLDAKPVKTAPVVAKAPVLEKKPVTAAAPVRVEKPAVKPIKWSLRSAQPGRAMIYNASTQDVLSIEVGDVVPGIGKVTSIAVEGGLWVVTGALGRVSQ